MQGRRSHEGLGIMTANATFWAHILDGVRVRVPSSTHILCVQEHRLPAVAIPEQSQRAFKAGWKTLWEPAVVGPAGGKCMSSGCVTLVRKCVIVREHKLVAEVGHKGRLVAAVVETGKLGRVCVYNMYGRVQQPRVTAELWTGVLRDAAQHGMPWVCVGDFNCSPACVALAVAESHCGAEVRTPPSTRPLASPPRTAAPSISSWYRRLCFRLCSQLTSICASTYRRAGLSSSSLWRSASTACT